MGYTRKCETSDFNKNDKLRTRYYKADYRKTSSTILDFAKKCNYQVLNQNDEYKEITLKKGQIEITLAIIEVSPIEVSVDLVVTRYPYDFIGIPLPDFKVCEKYVGIIYSNLDKLLTLKRVGGQR